MKILITYGTRPLAQRLVRLLQQQQHETVLATCEAIPTILKDFHPIPNAKNPTFAHEMLKLCLDLGVEYVVPLSVEEIRSLHEARILFEEYEISLLIPAVLENVSFVQHPPATQQLYLFATDALLLSGEEIPPVGEKVGLYTRHEGDWCLVTL